MKAINLYANVKHYQGITLTKDIKDCWWKYKLCHHYGNHYGGSK